MRQFMNKNPRLKPAMLKDKYVISPAKLRELLREKRKEKKKGEESPLNRRQSTYSEALKNESPSWKAETRESNRQTTNASG